VKDLIFFNVGLNKLLAISTYTR